MSLLSATKVMTAWPWRTAGGALLLLLIASLSGPALSSDLNAATNAQAAEADDGQALAPQPPADCQCLWQGSFSEVATTADLVALGAVTRVRGNAVDIALERRLLGREWREDLRVWVKAKDYCRPDPALFRVGSRWVMAIDKIEAVPEDGFDPSTPNLSYGRKHDYTLSNCGGYFLRASGDGVQGNLLPDMPRWAHDTDMTPVLINLVAGYLQGNVSLEALEKAAEEDPAAKALMLDTRSFLRGQDQWLEDGTEPN